jgi:hypothetical protein
VLGPQIAMTFYNPSRLDAFVKHASHLLQNGALRRANALNP